MKYNVTAILVPRVCTLMLTRTTKCRCAPVSIGSPEDVETRNMRKHPLELCFKARVKILLIQTAISLKVYIVLRTASQQPECLKKSNQGQQEMLIEVQVCVVPCIRRSTDN